MERCEIKELHYMTATRNLPSILKLGILSHEASRAVNHLSIADKNVQARRAMREVPGGLRLHQYANLFFNARNAMLYKVIREGRAVEDLAILRVAHGVLDEPGVVVTDINAAAEEEPRCHTVAEGLPMLDSAVIWAEWWRHPDPQEMHRRKQKMMAEVLVPHCVQAASITGAYVISGAAAEVLSGSAPTLTMEVNPYMFFKGERP